MSVSMPERDDKWESCLAIATVQLLFVVFEYIVAEATAVMV